MNPLVLVVPALVLAGFLYLRHQASPPGDASFPPEGVQRLPDISGANLAGDVYRLPADFEAGTNLVLIAFQQEHQRLIDTWLPLARELEAEHDDLAYYELPVVGDRGPAFRAWLDNVMRAGIPDPKARATTITLYTDVNRFVDALGLGSASTIHALLVDRGGEVRWRASGAMDAEAAASLKAALAARGASGAGSAAAT